MTTDLQLRRENTYFFDDKDENIHPFRGNGHQLVVGHLRLVGVPTGQPRVVVRGQKGLRFISSLRYRNECPADFLQLSRCGSWLGCCWFFATIALCA